MNNVIEHRFALLFTLCFAFMWAAVTTLLGALSGWFLLMARFPDRVELALLKVRGQSGSMGFGVSFGNVLRLSVCPSGLRIGVFRLFGLFCRDFFVPWEAITITRKKRFLFQPRARLRFGNPPVGSLTISAHVADRLARAAMERWPEATPPRQENRQDRLKNVFIRWAVATTAAALFFTLAPLFVAPKGARPPIAVAVLFPAVVFGVFAALQYLFGKD